MKTLPELLLLTRDEGLPVRLRAVVSPFARLECAASPAELEAVLATLPCPVLFLDLRRPDLEETLDYYLDHPRQPVLVALAADDSEPARLAAQRGVLAVLDPAAGATDLLRVARMAVAHAALLREVQEVRALSGASRPAPGPVRPPVALAGFLRSPPHGGGLAESMQAAVEALCASTGLARAGVFVQEDSGRPFTHLASCRAMRGARRLSYSGLHPLPLLLEQGGAAVVRAQLAEPRTAADHRVLLAALDATGADLLFPLFAGDGMPGWLYAGRFADGRACAPEDLDALAAAAAHLAHLLGLALERHGRTLRPDFAAAAGLVLPAGVVCVDRDAVVRWLNPEAARLLGLRPEEAVDQPVARLGGWIASHLLDALDGKAEPVLVHHPGPGGTLVDLSVRLLPGGTGAAALLLDRTAEASHREHRERDEEAAFWRDLAGGLSHEIRNPLTAVRLIGQLLPERHDDPEFREHARVRIEASVTQLARVLETIDRFARPPRADFAPTRLRSLLDRAADQARALTGRPRAEIRVESGLDEASLSADGAALSEALAQLLVNAFEATDGQAGARVTLEAHPSALDDDTPAVLLTIADNGPGIPPGLRERVFSPFHTSKARGLGLGLPTARRTVQAHGGTLEIESTVPGTRVHVRLPLARAT